jgi:hypothetical protein
VNQERDREIERESLRERKRERELERDYPQERKSFSDLPPMYLVARERESVTTQGKALTTSALSPQKD